MSKKMLFALAFAAMGSGLRAQPLQKSVHDAFMISRMAEKYHVQPHPLDHDLSAIIYTQLMNELDDEKIFFTQDDIHQLSAFQYKLDDEIRSQHAVFLHLLSDLYKLRLQQADTMIDKICATPFNFTIKEKLTVAEYEGWPAGMAGMHSKLYKLLKQAVLSTIVEYAGESDKMPAQKSIDILERVIRKRAGTSVKRSIKRVLQSPQGVEYIIGNDYCQAIASSYDPHTAYFPPEEKEAFESQLGNKPLAFGLSLNEDEDGNAQIGHLVPGSPAFQSGSLNEGDKIQSIQWDDKEPIDVSNADLDEIDQVLATTGGARATLTVKKADGTLRQVTLHKERLSTGDDEEDRVQGFILQGSKNIGYISLPAFYSDWEDSKGTNGCANDVARQVIKLKKENIQGLILDLRYNGGGSIQEAVDLSGIFIDAGPVEQIKSRDPKVLTLKDVNRGTVYDGPLIVLVNGFSASASEMVAGTLQDYNRAVIVGSPTYGKATGQVVLPIDTTVDLQTYDGHAQADSYIKMTTLRLYRITGATAQFNGVKPNIVLPEPANAQGEREKDEKTALVANNIEPNKYYKPLPPLPFAALESVAQKEIDSSAYFREALTHAAPSKGSGMEKDFSLLLSDHAAEMKKTVTPAVPATQPEKAPAFTVVNQAYEKQRLLADSDLKQMNEERKLLLVNDPYVKVAFHLLLAMTK
ncbi:MAG TPA: S41 family peptidase [Chitinophagaceae bacterium]|jgi:carboxyl-terminal processing protease